MSQILFELSKKTKIKNITNLNWDINDNDVTSPSL